MKKEPQVVKGERIHHGKVITCPLQLLDVYYKRMQTENRLDHFCHTICPSLFIEQLLFILGVALIPDESGFLPMSNQTQFSTNRKIESILLHSDLVLFAVFLSYF